MLDSKVHRLDKLVSLDTVLHRSDSELLCRGSQDDCNIKGADSVWDTSLPFVLIVAGMCEEDVAPPLVDGVVASMVGAWAADKAALSPGGELSELGKLSAVERDGKCFESILFP